MARNLQGFFNGGSDCRQFSLKIIANPTSNTFEEIYLAGESPVVVTYDVSNTPFDPIRKPRASITVVSDNKFLDVFSSDAQGTQVILKDETNNEIQWVGYLTANLLNAPDIFCGAETFTLEAVDCLTTLKQFNYETISGKKAIVSLANILIQIANKCELIDTMYVDASIKRSNNTYVDLAALTISEQNFFSSDTDDPWTLGEVLEEICRYLGYTAVQYKSSLYLFDMQSHVGETFQPEQDTPLSYPAYRYRKSSGWNHTFGNWTDLADGIVLRQELFRGTGADISLETLYNKVQVKDSFYEVEQFVPDLFKDDLLTNRTGEFWDSNSIQKTGRMYYISKSGRSKKEEKDESEHIYYTREFDHDNYESVYRDPTTFEETAATGDILISNLQINNNNQGGQGTLDVSATFTNKSGSNKTIHLEGELEYTWYNGNVDSNYDSATTSTTIAPGRSATLSIHCHAAWDTSYQMTYTADQWYRIGNKKYPLVQNDTSNFVGADIVDLAVFDKPMSTAKYNYETESSISFKRYLRIHQLDKPAGRLHPYQDHIFLQDMEPMKDSEISTLFPSVFRLETGYINPFIYCDNTYISIDAEAIWERYNLPYINPDWTKENSCISGLGLFGKANSIVTVTPALIFKLKIGDKYWSSQSGWTSTDSCFVVNMSTDKTDKDDVDFTAWYNTEHTALNNVSWTEWSGLNGYKIPLEPGLNLNQDIVFEVHLPSRIQQVDTNEYYSGENNYVWVSKLDIGISTKDTEVYPLSDVLYENIIDSGSTNTLSDITCKLTSYPGHGPNSYSNVALDGSLAVNIKKTGLNDDVNRPEENVVKTYTNQYCSPTIKESMTLVDTITPFSRIYDPTVERYFGILGSTIDYKAGSQTITLIETKTWDPRLDL